jgi:hypothetical protein
MLTVTVAVCAPCETHPYYVGPVSPVLQQNKLTLPLYRTYIPRRAKKSVLDMLKPSRNRKCNEWTLCALLSVIPAFSQRVSNHAALWRPFMNPAAVKRCPPSLTAEANEMGCLIIAPQRLAHQSNLVFSNATLLNKNSHATNKPK